MALAALLWCIGLQAQDLPGADLASLLALAREGNPEYASMRLEAQAAAERVQVAGALPDPKLRVELMDVTRGDRQSPTLLPGKAGGASYSFMQELPGFGKRGLRREQARFEADAAGARSLGTWAEVEAAVKMTFAELYYLHRNRELTREILDLLARLEATAQARYAGGLAAQQDVIRAQAEQTALQAELVELETELHHLHARMNALLGRPAETPLAEPRQLRALPPPAVLDAASLEAQVRARNPLLAAEEALLLGAQKNREITYRNRYPDFALGLVPNQMGNSLDQWDLMFEVNIPLQQKSRRAQEREAQAMLDAARERRRATVNALLAELAEHLSSLDAARRIEALVAGSLLPQAQLTFQSALAGYENGQVDFATLLDAQRQIRESRQRVLQAQTDAQARLADIERILGGSL